MSGVMIPTPQTNPQNDWNLSLRIAILSLEHDDYATEFANAVAHHAKVTLLVSKRTYGDRAWHLRDDVELHVLDWPRQRQLRNITFALRVSRLLSRFEPDVIHLLSPTAWLSLLRPLVRAPIVSTIHDVMPHPGDKEVIPLITYLRVPTLRASSGLIVHGESLRQVAISRFPPRPIFVMQHIAVTRYARLAERSGFVRDENDSFRVLFFGRIFPYKGLKYLLEARSSVLKRAPNVQFTIAGRGDISELLPLVENGSNTTVLNRFVPDAETAKLFIDADVVVLPYIEASESGVAAIATGFGLPVIATDVGELPDTITHMRNGLIVRSRDAGSLADAITRLATDTALCRQLAAGAREQAAASRGPSAIGKTACNIYAQVMSTSQDRSSTGRHSVARSGAD